MLLRKLLTASPAIDRAFDRPATAPGDGDEAARKLCFLKYLVNGASDRFFLFQQICREQRAASIGASTVSAKRTRAELRALENIFPIFLQIIETKNSLLVRTLQGTKNCPLGKNLYGAPFRRLRAYKISKFFLKSNPRKRCVGSIFCKRSNLRTFARPN